jgi:hypothetical protein
MRPRSRHLAERSAVPVHRQNAAIKVGNSISGPEVTQYTKVVSEVEKRVVVRDDVIFVNNGGAQGNGIAAHGSVEDGTAERPYDTIQEGVDLSATAGYQAKGVPTVYVSGTSHTYDQDGVQVSKSVNLTSGGFGVGAYAEQRFGEGMLAQLPSGLKADLTGRVSLAINGFDLGGIEIRGDGKQNIFIRGNRIGIHQGDTPITTFYVEEIGDITVVGNTIGGNPSDSGVVFASGVGGGSANFSFNTSTVAMSAFDFGNATFIGNRVVAFDGGISVTASGSIVIQSNDIRIIGSLRGTGEEGIGITAVSRHGSLAKLTISENRIVLDDSNLDANSSGIAIAGQVLFDSSYGNEVISLGRNPNSATLTIIRAFQSTLWFGGSVEINGTELRFGAPQMADSTRWFQP